MRLSSLFLASLALTFAFSCGKTPEEEKPEVKPEIKVPAESQAVFSSGITFGESTGTDKQTTSVSFTATESWSADVSDVKSSSWLSVQPTSGGAGTVNMSVIAEHNTGESSRSAKVTIKCGTVTKYFTVTQAGNPPAVVVVTSVTLDKTELSLKVGDEATLVATVSPENASDKTVTWSTSDATVATINNGVVTALKIGSATVTAKAGDKTATCAVTVVATPVTSVSLNITSASLQVSETLTLTATVAPDDATDKTVTWSTSDESVATVNNGVVTAVKIGSATITAKAGDKTATCEISVVAPPAVPVSSVSLNKTDASLKVGETVTLTATVNPDNASDKTVTWSTSDASVATVNNGVVSAVKVGTATITAKAGDKSATCTITVNPTPVASISLNTTSASLQVSETLTLIATVTPDDATDKTVTWSTSDESIATVNNGVVTAVKIGSATITAKAGEKSATCEVSVVAPPAVPVSSVTLNKTDASLKVGETVTLTATVNPDDATDKTVTWSTSDASVATVSNGVVTAVKVGTATITAKAGDKSASCVITVEATPVTSVTLDKTDASLKVAETVTLTATVKPDDATDKTVTWSTSDASVATVSNGVITAVKIGSATITAKAGDKSATCAITVVATPVTSVTLDKTDASLKVGETVTLTATVNPDNASDKTVTWSTSDASVATVSNGVVTAVKVGTATITAKAGDKEATCVITVTPIVVVSLTLDKESVTMKVSESITLKATVNPSNAPLTWTSSDNETVTVFNGVITALKSGDVTITVSSGGKSAKCAVKVSDSTNEIGDWDVGDNSNGSI